MGYSKGRLKLVSAWGRFYSVWGLLGILISTLISNDESRLVSILHSWAWRYDRLRQHCSKLKLACVVALGVGVRSAAMAARNLTLTLSFKPEPQDPVAAEYAAALEKDQ